MYTHKSYDREDGSYRRWWNITERFGFKIELNWKSHSYHIDPVKFDDDDGAWGFSFAFRPLSLYFFVNVPRVLQLKESRELGFSFHGGAFWWNLWTDPMGEYPSRHGRWRNSCFHIDDFLFGKSKCETRVLEERDILVPMPEKAYPAHAKLIEYSWSRPRWFTKRMKRVEINVEGGVPHEGKGENSWDCGHDATFWMTTGECHSIPQGIGIFVGSVLRDRVKYGGWGDLCWNKS